MIEKLHNIGFDEKRARGIIELLETEEKLGLVARFSSQKEDLSYIVARLEEIRERGEPVDDIINRAKKML